MSQLSIMARLEKELIAFLVGKSIIFQAPNITVNIPKGTEIWVKWAFLPFDTISRDMARKNRVWSGILQIDIYTTRGVGNATATELADEIAEIVYNPSVTIVEGEARITITEPASLRPAADSGVWAASSVDVYYRADVYLV